MAIHDHFSIRLKSSQPTAKPERAMAEMDEAEMVRVQGQVLVRRFTHELQGNTPLEQETKALQKKIDEEEEARYQEHLESLYDELGGHASYEHQIDRCGNF